MDSGSGSGSMSDRAVSEIRQRVIHGDLAPGASFSEADIAQRLQMSKAPVREALAVLRRLGWVEVIPRSGYRVPPVTLRGMQDLFELRLWLEPEAAALAARHGARRPEQIAALQEFCAREEERGAEDPAAWLTDHYRAHRRIAVLSGNAELERVLDEVLLKMERYHALDVIGSAAGSGGNESAHRRLVEAIAAGDSAAARDLATLHVRQARDRAVAAVLDSEALRAVDLTSLGPPHDLPNAESRLRSA
ncbi:GntR family transcriptional regulator [Streptomyces sp. NPDC007162]|uniref:GntR family transcriptional regulator n=1 Tax=Streptomyces sp. NPDC007162 TaxID=3156917 RepID=UPI003402F78C